MNLDKLADGVVSLLTTRPTYADILWVVSLVIGFWMSPVAMSGDVVGAFMMLVVALMLNGLADKANR